MNEVSNIIIRLRELAIQASSDTIGTQERSYSNKEYNQLIDEIDRIGSIVEFNGLKLLRGGTPDGEMKTLTVHVGAGDGLAVNTDTIELDIGQLKTLTSEGLGLTGGAAVGPLGRDDLESFTREMASEKLQVLDNALMTLNGFRAELGAKQSRLGSTISNLNIAHENLSASKSRIRDVDYAEETASYTQNRILQQGGVSILSQANAGPEIALTLLR